MPEQVKAQAKKVTIYTATAPFELDGNRYEAGDQVALPGWTLDAAYDAARKEALIDTNELKGVTFWKEGPIVDKVTKERNLYRVTIPVKE